MVSNKMLSAQRISANVMSLGCLQLPGTSGLPESNYCDPVSAISDIQLVGFMELST